MPIYAYRCQSCGHEQDVLQKLSDAPLTDCPQCGQPAFKKQLTAAGFQLKGSGWYVTDFRNKASGGSGKAAGTAAAASTTSEAGSGSGGASGEGGGKSEAPSSSGGSCAPGCGCH